MLEQGVWDEEREEQLRDGLRVAIEEAIRQAEHAAQPPATTLFDDVYETMPAHLEHQKASGLKVGEDQEIQGRFPL